MFRILSALILCFAALPRSAPAHEFWLSPQSYQVEKSAKVFADLRNGEEFDGFALGYFPNRFTRFDWRLEHLKGDVIGRIGDTPAVQMDAPSDGLLIIAHASTSSTLRYTVWDKFAAFAAHKDFPDIAARHDARGLPRSDFRESYTRHAKTLIAIGTGQGTDQIMGLETEFVALTNPYLNPPQDIDVLLLYQGEPRPDAQIEIFDRTPDGTVTVTTTRTDTAGKARIAVAAGHEYLLDAVVLRPAPEGAKAVWETLWAALTFAVP